MQSDNNGSNIYDGEYHYNYRPDYAEPWDAPPTPELKKPKRSRKILKVTAIVLAAVLVVGGAFGGGWLLSRHVGSGASGGGSVITVSDREKPEIQTVNVTGSQKLTYPEIYAANVNACVSINVTSEAGYNFFGQMVQNASSGSGFIITSDGYIVTNYHVISGGASVEVTLYDGRTYNASIIGGDEEYDVAVIKIDPGEEKLQTVVLGTSGSLQVGDDVVAIGNPLGELTFSMSEGIVSCLDREINLDGTPYNMIQITAPVNHGNSGGPLFNIYGEVVGIVSAKSEDSSYTVEGLGFALPMDDVLPLIQDIMENGQVTSHAYMGVTVDNAANYSAETGVSAGAYLVSVVSGGPADKAGLQKGDVITMVGSTLISSASDLTGAVGGKTYKAGDTATVTYVRSGQVASCEITFGSTTEMPAEDETAQNSGQSSDSQSGYGDYYGNYGGYGDMEDFFNYFFGGKVN